jgi:hypothetical protein
MNVSPNVVIMTTVEMMQRLQEAEARGREQGALDAAAKLNPAVPNRIFRLKEALLLCGQAAAGTRYAWEGSAIEMPPEAGTSLGDRVNRIGEIVNRTFSADPLDEHRGNTSLAFQLLEKYYRDNPDLDVRSWMGRLVREKQAKAGEPLSALGKAAMQLEQGKGYGG